MADKDKSSECNSIELNYNELANSEYVAPVFRDRKNGTKYIDYGNSVRGKSNNDFPDELLYYKNNCGLHNAILNYRIAQVTGRGFLVKDEDAATKKFLENINESEDANEVLAKVALDLVVFGGFSILVTWDKGWKKIVRIKHIGFNRVRVGSLNSAQTVDKYYYRYDWSKGSREDIVEFPAYNASEAKTKADKIKGSKYDEMTIKQLSGSDKNTQLLYFTPYNPSSFYYPLPKYIGCLNSVATSIETDLYGRSIMTNGMAPTTMITLFGNMTEGAFRKEAKTIVKNGVGARKAGTLQVLKAQSRETAPEIKEIAGNGKDNKFNDLNKKTIQDIISGHCLPSPVLAGFETSGVFGDSSELEKAYEVDYTRNTVPEQNVITKVFNKLMKVNRLQPLSIDKLGLFENLDSKDNNNEIDTNN